MLILYLDCSEYIFCSNKVIVSVRSEMFNSSAYKYKYIVTHISREMFFLSLIQINSLDLTVIFKVILNYVEK